jgi:hypothetical protein
VLEAQGGNPIGSPVELESIFSGTKFLADLLKNENMKTFEMQPGIMMERLRFFTTKGWIKLNDDKSVEIVDGDYLYMLKFLAEQIQPMFDTYVTVLAAIDQMAGKNLVLKEKTLIKELHVALKSLYELGAVPFLHSCL